MAIGGDGLDPIRKLIREELQLFGTTVLKQELEDLANARSVGGISSVTRSMALDQFRPPAGNQRSSGGLMDTAGGFLFKRAPQVGTEGLKKRNQEIAERISSGGDSSYSQLLQTESEERLGVGEVKPKLVRSLSKELGNEETLNQHTHLSLNRLIHSTVHYDAAEIERRAQHWVDSLLLSSWFNPLTGLLITLNALSIGVETDYMARHWTEHGPVTFKYINLAFLVYFIVEILFRLLSSGWAFFKYSWNIFDLSMVLLQLMEVTVAALEQVLPPSVAHLSRNQVMMWRILRLLRLLRIFRFFRILNMFTGLRMLVAAVQDSMKSLLWSMTLIAVIVYTLAVCITQLVTNYKVQNHDSPGNDELEKFYGDLLLSMLSLYEAISEGMHWHELMDPLQKYCSPWMALIFSAYMAFCTFALLNVITGIFVESAIDAGREDKKVVLLNRMMVLFRQADQDGNGAVDVDEFRSQLGNDEMLEFLKEVQLDEEEAMDLFHMLDIHGTGEVDPEEFVNGCMRLNGFAKAIDLAAFMHEFRLFQGEFHEHSGYVHRAVGKIYENLQLQQSTE